MSSIGPIASIISVVSFVSWSLLERLNELCRLRSSRACLRICCHLYQLQEVCSRRSLTSVSLLVFRFVLLAVFMQILYSKLEAFQVVLSVSQGPTA